MAFSRKLGDLIFIYLSFSVKTSAGSSSLGTPVTLVMTFFQQYIEGTFLTYLLIFIKTIKGEVSLSLLQITTLLLVAVITSLLIWELLRKHSSSTPN